MPTVFETTPRRWLWFPSVNDRRKEHAGPSFQDQQHTNSGFPVLNVAGSYRKGFKSVRFRSSSMCHTQNWIRINTSEYHDITGGIHIQHYPPMLLPGKLMVTRGTSWMLVAEPLPSLVGYMWVQDVHGFNMLQQSPHIHPGFADDLLIFTKKSFLLGECIVSLGSWSNCNLWLGDNFEATRVNFHSWETTGSKSHMFF